MKILHCIHSLDPAVGGPFEALKQMSLVLAERGHTLEVACLDAPDSSSVLQFPVTVHAFGPGWRSYGYSPRLVPWIRQDHERFDAVVVHGIWQYHSFATWRALHQTTTPYFVFAHGMLDPWFKRAYPLKHFKKLLYWRWGEYRVLRDAAAVLFTSEEERRLARESFVPYHCRETVVNLGITGPEIRPDAAREGFYEAFPQLRHRNFLLFLGRIHLKKGVEELIRAFAAAKGISELLVIAGPCADKDYLKRLEHLTNEFGLADRVIFTGMLSGGRKWGALVTADAFILPSHQENFGIAVVEALSCGTPVLISTRVNIWREIVAAGGGFAENDDLLGTKRLLERWFATLPEDRKTMATRARDTFAERFETHRAVDLLLAVLEKTRRNG
jgi:glycosyltransferase involved in cell wall biosynthesis